MAAEQPTQLRTLHTEPPPVDGLRDRPETGRPPGVLLTTDEVAELCRVSRRCVERWDSAGKVPGKVRLPGRLIRWRREVIERWLAEGCPVPRPPRGPLNKSRTSQQGGTESRRSATGPGRSAHAAPGRQEEAGS